VNVSDQRVGMRAARGVPPEHPGGEQIAGVGELAGHLGNRVDAPDALADAPDLQRASGRGHSGRVLGSGTGTRPARTMPLEPEIAVCSRRFRTGPGLGSGTGTRLDRSITSLPPV